MFKNLDKFIFICFVLFAAAINGCDSGSSSGGETWQAEGVFYGPTDFTSAEIVADVSVVNLDDGRLRMYISVSKGLFGTALYSSVSTDETNWVIEDGSRLASVSVSRPIRLSSGGYRLYYNDTDNAGILSAISSDGLVWTAEAGTRIATGGAYDAAAVDFGTAVQLSDGTFRAYYGGANSTGSVIPFAICSAISSDGLTFTKEGISLSSATGRATHPHVFVYNSQYLMYYSTNDYIYKAVSSDGLTWTEVGSTGILGGDPFIVQLADGDWRMFYGTYDAVSEEGFVNSAIWRR